MIFSLVLRALEPLTVPDRKCATALGFPIVFQNFISSMLFRFGTISSAPFFLRETFTANAARPPVETAPATTNPMVAKQNGHIIHLLGRRSLTAKPPL